MKQIGIECWPSDLSNNEDSNSYSVKVFNCANIAEGIRSHNWGLPWEKKADILNLDEEFWGMLNPTNDFHTTHIPMLRAMYAAAHECGDNYLRVEDYIEEPTNLNNTSFNINDSIDVMEADSIALYTDRILNSVYSYYHIALWNEADFRLAYPNFGNNPNKNMEIWPAFGAENYNMGSCPKFWYLSGDNFSGSNLCTLTKIDTADWIEQQYYDSLCFSEKYKEFTSTISNPTPMGADTNFEILGSMWYDYRAIDTERINFDTNTRGVNKGYLRYYVTLPHDSMIPFHNDIRDTMPPIPITATVHGGKSPYNYIWYDMSNNDAILQSSSSNTYYATYSPTYPSKIRVLAIDGGDSTSTDYMCIYQMCGTNPLHKPIKPNHTAKYYNTISNTGSVMVYPNPNKGSFTMEFQGVNSPCLIEIYNVMGEKVYSECSNNNSLFSINLSSQANGVYFYRVTSDSATLIGNGKIVIEK